MQHIRIPICLQEPLDLTESQEPRVKNRERENRESRIEARVENLEQETSQEPRPREPRPREPRPRDESRTENKRRAKTETKRTESQERTTREPRSRGLQQNYKLLVSNSFIILEILIYHLLQCWFFSFEELPRYHHHRC